MADMTGRPPDTGNRIEPRSRILRHGVSYFNCIRAAQPVPDRHARDLVYHASNLQARLHVSLSTLFHRETLASGLMDPLKACYRRPPC
jgi:hypothetical protein